LRRSLHSIHSRLFLLFLSSMTALLLIASFLYYKQSTDLVQEKIGVMAEKNISQTVGLFNLLLKGYDSVTKNINSSTELIRLLEEQEDAPNPSNERAITSMIASTFYSRDDILGIHIITESHKIYSFVRSYAGVVNRDYASASWYQKLQNSRGEMIWIGLSQGSVLNDLQQDPVFVFGRKLFDLSDYRELGTLVIETEPKAILAALSNVTISPNSRVYLVNNDNKVVATTDDEKISPVNFNELPRPVGEEVIAEIRGNKLVTSANTALAGWTVFGLTPKEDISEQFEPIRETMLVAGLLLIVLSTALATFVSRTISSPLKLLIREMKQVELGNFTRTLNVKSYDEINSLVMSFNRMVQRMDELIEDITSASLSEKNAQLQALQSQVNPHFLYNTLDMIYWMLDERENDRLGRVILALSQMFRYSSEWEQASRTTLRDELDQMRHYMTIIENRLEGRLQTEIQVDETWLEAALPKMTIQPIIENAVKSGLEPLKNAGLLRVYAETTDRELHIVIQDNGVGIDAETLLRLQRSLTDEAVDKSKQDARRGIGLLNVHRRIGLMFGERYGLRIESMQGAGTTVTIVMPLPGERRELS